jgi:hypothetical protein
MIALALVDAVDVRPGQVVLIVGATGGLGGYATQLVGGGPGDRHRTSTERDTPGADAFVVIRESHVPWADDAPVIREDERYERINATGATGSPHGTGMRRTAPGRL